MLFLAPVYLCELIKEHHTVRYSRSNNMMLLDEPLHMTNAFLHRNKSRIICKELTKYSLNIARHIIHVYLIIGYHSKPCFFTIPFFPFKISSNYLHVSAD